jgi:hypothetical protein
VDKQRLKAPELIDEMNSAMTELKVLQAVRMKGRVNRVDLAATLSDDPEATDPVIDNLTDAGLPIAGKTLRLSHEGRAKLTDLLGEERKSIDVDAVTRVKSNRLANDHR